MELGFNIIAVREEFSHLTLAELYDPNKMPDKLRV
ncbi:type IIL restriction-modification enzyme MmeI, partial [Acinetobacter baumannii]